MRFLFVNRTNGMPLGINYVGFRRKDDDFKEYKLVDGKLEECEFQNWDNEVDFLEANDRMTTEVIDLDLESEEDAIKKMNESKTE